VIPRATLALVLVLAGCAGGLAPPTPLPGPTTAIPDLRGTWAGTWGGTPLTLVLVEHKEFGGSPGIYLGPVRLLGQPVPGVSGVMTCTVEGHPVSASVQGWLGSSGGALTLVLNARTLHGSQWLTLIPREEHLSGTGESEFRWGPRGRVQLIRRPAT
jgi:hypothetical protein